MKRFRELGGRYITFGSDAHYVRDLAGHFDAALEAAQYAGFPCSVFYQQRSPMEMPFD